MKIPGEGPVVVSACLAGVACTHDAEAKTRGWALKLIEEGRAVPVCPEMLGGLGLPRPAAEIRQGTGDDVLDGEARVIDEHGRDVTDNYLAGASAAARAAARANARLAILKARSPSCGCGQTYDGTFSGSLREGDGVTAARLKRDGLTVLSDEDVVDE